MRKTAEDNLNLKNMELGVPIQEKGMQRLPRGASDDRRDELCNP